MKENEKFDSDMKNIENGAEAENFNLLDTEQEVQKPAESINFSGPIYANGVNTIETPKDISVPVENVGAEVQMEIAGESVISEEVINRELGSAPNPVTQDPVIITTPQKKKMNKKVLLVVAAVVFVLGLGGGAFAFVQMNNSPEKIFLDAFNSLSQNKSIKVDSKITLGLKLPTDEEESQKIGIDISGQNLIQKLPMEASYKVSVNDKVAEVKNTDVGLEGGVKMHADGLIEVGVKNMKLLEMLELKKSAGVFDEIYKMLDEGGTWKIDVPELLKIYGTAFTSIEKVQLETVYKCGVEILNNAESYNKKIMAFLGENFEAKFQYSEQNLNYYSLQAKKKMNLGVMFGTLMDLIKNDYIGCASKAGQKDLVTRMEKMADVNTDDVNEQMNYDVQALFSKLKISVDKKERKIKGVEFMDNYENELISDIGFSVAIDGTDSVRAVQKDSNARNVKELIDKIKDAMGGFPVRNAKEDSANPGDDPLKAKVKKQKADEAEVKKAEKQKTEEADVKKTEKQKTEEVIDYSVF